MNDSCIKNISLYFCVLTFKIPCMKTKNNHFELTNCNIKCNAWKNGIKKTSFNPFKLLHLHQLGIALQWRKSKWRWYRWKQYYWWSLFSCCSSFHSSSSGLRPQTVWEMRPCCRKISLSMQELTGKQSITRCSFKYIQGKRKACHQYQYFWQAFLFLLFTVIFKFILDKWQVYQLSALSGHL